MAANRKPLHHHLAPATWPTWIGLGLLRAVCWLPHSSALLIGRGLGRLARLIGGRRRAIVRRNIALCFPDLTSVERELLTRRHFAALGMSMIEMGLARWASDRRLNSITTIEGVQHVLDAVNNGHGVILMSAHFTTLELSGRVLKLNIPPFDAVYRKSRSDFATEVLRSGRERSAASTIEKQNIKSMVRSLRDGRIVWYAPDQSYSRKGAEVIPFFGVPSMHTTATSTLARLGKAVTIFRATTRLRTRRSTFAHWRRRYVSFLSNTFGHIASSRTCRNRIRTTMRIWMPGSSLPGIAPSFHVESATRDSGR